MLFGPVLRGGIFAWALVLAWPPAVFPEPNRLDEIAERFSRPEQLAAFLKREMTFQEDAALFGQVDYWQEPEEFLIRSAGDCEDYALFAEAILKRQGREVFVLSLYGEGGYAHTVCVFKEANRYHVLNQDSLVRYGAGSVEELAGLLCSRWVWGAVARRAGTRGQAVRKITAESRPSPSGFPATAGR